MAKAESRSLVAGYIAKGNKGNWLWEHLVQDIIKSEGIDAGERGKECAEHCAHLLRGYYPSRDKTWSATWEGKSEADLNLEYDHVVELVCFESKFVLANRPVPPKEEKPPKEPKAPKAKKDKDAPPAPPAPPGDAPAAPPVPAAPPPPPAA